MATWPRPRHLTTMVGLPNIVLTPHLGASTREAKEGVSRAVCAHVRDYLLHEKLDNAVNMRLSDLSILKEIQPYLDLSDLLGQLHAQLADGPIHDVVLQCSGVMEDTRPISLAFLKGLLETRVPERINYINAEAMAKELGVNLQISYTNTETNYTNLISTIVSVNGQKQRLDGSVFDQSRPRLVNVNGYDMEVMPQGTMLFIENRDMPGVIGHVGSFLGTENINIAAYFLSRTDEDELAFSVVRVDSQLSETQLTGLSEIEHIQSVKQIHVAR